ncbi:MAG TPA: hypothetical protein PL151_05040 [Phycisphaerae bacterium]|nr:hypothetical protein [Phycisphaerae bacterium]HOJ75918.1 hypothetical protein [Phycisphaerae bacterium]HOM52306.1 hypothetical protein [Phycisphaerae bacterium]HON65570.1 hypothetical protein [Phycisphaerae bacterium]HOQ84630.1 hypothetical protein [Phycisphaerae bacterium]
MQVTAGPDSPPFERVQIWPERNPEERTLTLDGKGGSVTTVLRLESDENFWIQISYGPSKKEQVQIFYERKKPFGFKAAQVINPIKANLGGSVPRIRS